MNKIKFLLCILALMLIICTLSACGGDPSGNIEDTLPSVDDTEIVNKEPEVKEFSLIEDKKSLYRIIRPDAGSAVNNTAAGVIHNHLLESGIRSELKGDWNKQEIGSDIREILVGNTQYNPDIDLPFELTDLGTKGFIIKNVGNKILILAGNEYALLGAAEFFIDNFLNIESGKTTMPENYEYISSNGKLLTSLTLGGKNISEFSVVSESHDSSAAELKALIEDKCAISLPSNGSSKIILTSKGATDGVISAKFENGDLVIRASDESSMKKAIFAFWFDNIGHAQGEYALPADTSYTLDLSKTVFYSDFNVKQSDGVCCMDDLIAAHNYANENGFKVYADLGGKYYISSTGKTVRIRTDVEWGNAEFTIDDSAVTNDKRSDWIFIISSSKTIYNIEPVIKSFTRDATKLDLGLPQKSIVTFYDDTKYQYIRYGSNANSGATKRDTVVIDTDGSIDMATPLMWDFDNVTSITVFPIDEKPLTVSGGIFTTISNKDQDFLVTYYARGIRINRSNVTLKNLEHYVTGEIKNCSPYSGFYQIQDCAYITIENCAMTGLKKVLHGTYDIGGARALSVTFKNCYQTNDISDTNLWGVMGTNYIKNITYDGCVLSRFDSHQGVTNATIKNSVLGHAGVSVVGYGTLTVENSIFNSNHIVNLRNDYGSTWDGNIIIKDCEFIPLKSGNATLIQLSNPESHDFGYTCYAPHTVEIDGVRVYSSAQVYILADPNKEHTSADYSPKFPYIPSKQVTVKNIKTNNNKAPILSPNTVFFRDTEFTVQ